NFDFDKSTLRPDAIAILDEAIEILKRYPDLRVEVAGHTDAIGTDAYNQGLSERRARAVYDYLTANGIDASRLVGPNGYGESRPIAPNTNPDGSDNPEGRAQNRRTELIDQNGGREKGRAMPGFKKPTPGQGPGFAVYGMPLHSGRIREGESAMRASMLSIAATLLATARLALPTVA